MIRFSCAINHEDFIDAERTSASDILFSMSNEGDEFYIYLDLGKAKAFAEEILSLVKDKTND